VFRRIGERTASETEVADRVDSVLGPEMSWKGDIGGSGGLRIEGAFDGNIDIDGLVVIGEQGRVTCQHIHARAVIVAGSVKGNLRAQRVEITQSGRVWGDVITESFATQEGAFMRGQIRMEDKQDIAPAEGGTQEGEQG
jgi:cytoskeletal protein CcmA (bactofilin family)